MVMGDLVREVDVAVVGGGPGGYTAAFRCAELGLETVVVDAAKRLGGACLFEGCIPSKALLHVAAVLGEAERAKEFGVDYGDASVSLDPLRNWKSERVIGKLARGLAGVAKAKNVDVVAGRAVFEDSRRLRVEGDEPQVVVFKHAIIATGSAPSPLPGLTLASDRIMDSTAALEVPDIPDRLLVVGGGYIGLELGQVYAALGSKVTLVEMTDGLLPGVDRDLVQPLARRCEKLFAEIRLQTKVTGLRETSGGVEVRLGDETLLFDRVLVAVGRRAQTQGLGLETTRVRANERGIIAVDDRCRTDDQRIYAVGDVTGEPMLAHRAMRQGRIAAEAIAGRPVAFDNVAVPAGGLSRSPNAGGWRPGGAPPAARRGCHGPPPRRSRRPHAERHAARRPRPPRTGRVRARAHLPHDVAAQAAARVPTARARHGGGDTDRARGRRWPAGGAGRANARGAGLPRREDPRRWARRVAGRPAADGAGDQPAGQGVRRTGCPPSQDASDLGPRARRANRQGRGDGDRRLADVRGRRRGWCAR